MGFRSERYPASSPTIEYQEFCRIVMQSFIIACSRFGPNQILFAVLTCSNQILPVQSSKNICF